MAIQIGKKPDGYKINRTPAPKLDRQKDAPTSYGQSGFSQPSSDMPDKPATMSLLARNLLESGQQTGERDETGNVNVLEKVIAGGLRGSRTDGISGLSDEERTVKADSYPLTPGANKRQQMDINDIGRPKLPASIDKTDAPSPAAAVQQPGRTRD